MNVTKSSIVGMIFLIILTMAMKTKITESEKFLQMKKSTLCAQNISIIILILNLVQICTRFQMSTIISV